VRLAQRLISVPVIPAVDPAAVDPLPVAPLPTVGQMDPLDPENAPEVFAVDALPRLPRAGSFMRRFLSLQGELGRRLSIRSLLDPAQVHQPSEQADPSSGRHDDVREYDPIVLLVYSRIMICEVMNQLLTFFP
jgi:hypothetical protein